MGVIYKLKPEIRDFVLNQKENDPRLTCRKLSVLVNEMFQIQISKSHINDIMKIHGLSSRVGRPLKPKRGLAEGLGLGAYLLKAADALLGGSTAISELLKEQLGKEPESLTIVEGLVYASLFGDALKADSGLWKLVGNELQNPEHIYSYIDSLQQVTTFKSKLSEVFKNIFKEVLWLKFTFSDGHSFVLDGQLHTLWPSSDIPYQFSTTYWQINGYINKCINGTEPIVFLTAPGYDLLPESWFDFLAACSSSDITLTKISFMGAKSQEISSITLSPAKSCVIIFGLWPWQYTNVRHIEPMPMTCAKSFSLQNTKQDFYLNDALIKLSQHNVNKEVILRGVIVRQSQQVKLPELFIATNLSAEKVSTEDLARLYLARWPNGKAGLEEFSRAIELFTYNTSFRQPFPAESVTKKISGGLENIKDFFRAYLETLDAYVRWYFLPREYREVDLSTTKDRFYGLRAQIRKKKDTTIVTFIPPSGYAFRKALTYAIERINERGIFLPDRNRLWFAINSLSEVSRELKKTVSNS